MPNVSIKQMDERVATAGVHFGMGPLAPKLEPGEVVHIPEGKMFETLWETGKLELSLKPVTRPLKYADVHEAMYCSPSYRPRDASDELVMARTRAAVAERLAKTRAPKKEPPQEEPPLIIEEDEGAAEARANRRAQRRAAIEGETGEPATD